MGVLAENSGYVSALDDANLYIQMRDGEVSSNNTFHPVALELNTGSNVSSDVPYTMMMSPYWCAGKLNIIRTSNILYRCRLQILKSGTVHRDCVWSGRPIKSRYKFSQRSRGRYWTTTSCSITCTDCIRTAEWYSKRE